jgi:hypothetical protein
VTEEVIYLLSPEHGEGGAFAVITHNQQVIYDLLKEINRKVSHEMGLLDAITTDVHTNTDVEASAVLLLQGLSSQLSSVAGDPVAVQALADELSTSSASLAAAVVANTPAAVVPPVDVPPVTDPAAPTV